MRITTIDTYDIRFPTSRELDGSDDLHEHFLDPAVVTRGAYAAPAAPGFSAEMRPETLIRYAFPGGPEWA